MMHDLYDDVLESILRDVLDLIPDGVFVVNADREIIYWNESAAQVTGYAPEDVVGARCCDLLGDQDSEGRRLCDDHCHLVQSMTTGKPRSAIETYLLRADGERLGVVATTRRLQIGDEVYGVEIFHQLTAVRGRDVAAAIQQLSDNSVTDPLTGLLNGHYVHALLEQQFALFRRVGLRFALTVVDVDAMKSFNADFGRPTGDELLRFIAGILGDNTRKMDTLARLESDDFLIVSPVRAEAGAEEIGRRALELIRGSRFTTASEEVAPIRVSIGGAVVRGEDKDVTETLKRAQTVMQEIRAGGGNGFRFSV
jgi:diguanylate cyclase (GGDEF)-like protein/PAS domain S-box-containing protein